MATLLNILAAAAEAGALVEGTEIHVEDSTGRAATIVVGAPIPNDQEA